MVSDVFLAASPNLSISGLYLPFARWKQWVYPCHAVLQMNQDRVMCFSLRLEITTYIYMFATVHPKSIVGQLMCPLPFQIHPSVLQSPILTLKQRLSVTLPCCLPNSLTLHRMCSALRPESFYIHLHVCSNLPRNY